MTVGVREDMNISGKHYRTIWPVEDGHAVHVIDQTRLPFALAIRLLESAENAANAIQTMVVRGAPLIGVTAAYGLALAMRDDPRDSNLAKSASRLMETRPTAVNLRWALELMQRKLSPLPLEMRAQVAFHTAGELADQDVSINESIGVHGLALLRNLAGKKPAGAIINVLTHCNAGWLATVDWGTATAPIYKAHDEGMNIHVWVDETRPRNQGASLTAFELGHHGVPHTVIPDNAGGHLMQHGQVDLVIVGSDRTTRRGDVANKIGTYLKALAAHDNGVPFYVALPTPTIDLDLDDGVAGIPIEQRSEREVTHIIGQKDSGEVATVRIVPEGSRAANYGFDVTPARLVSGLITERGLVPATEAGIASLFA
jgi:methylthioribose-1-phosphate isomerase